jgi:pimeloyl-ACP methyl ester carboxylesterase
MFIKALRIAQRKSSPFPSIVIDTPIAPIEFCKMGKNETPVLISHGITGGFDQGVGLSRLYIGNDVDLIAVSRFGYLKSPLPTDSSPSAQADAYKHLLDELNIDKAYVFGNSAGGTSAFQFAMKYPNKCLGCILVSSNVPSNVGVPPKPVMKAIFASNFIYWIVVKVMGDHMLSTAGVPKAILKQLSRQEKDILHNDVIMGGFPIKARTKGILNDMFVSNPDINNGYNFEQINVPVLMISAVDDPLCSYEGAVEVSKRVPNCRLISYEDGGHIIIGHENEIKERIAEFIDLNHSTTNNAL